jgi:chemotaxis protein MotA
MAKAKAKSSFKPDITTIGGIVLAVGGILTGLIMEKGSVKDVAQVSAAIIVLGGTIGAVCVSTPLGVMVSAVKRLKLVFLDTSRSPQAIIEEIITYAAKARKGGIVSLEQEAESIADPFLKKALNLAIDGADLPEIRKMLELEIGLTEHRFEAEAKVFEAAGGYAPTVGIIGAVLGLIQVMKHLENMDEVGKGIAVAFVATVYGVGCANIFFLPAATKLKARTHAEIVEKELMLEGVISIVEGLNPKLIRTKLEAYAQSAGPAKNKPKDKAKEAKKPAAGKAAA